jgi:hypothetical protein
MFEEEQISVLDPIDEFYSKKHYFSYSGLKLLLWSPPAWKERYINKQREESIEKHLIEGKVIHCKLLNNHLFDRLFLVSPTTLPSGNTKKVLDKLFKIYEQQGSDPELNSISDRLEDLLQILRDVDLHQSLSTDEKRIAKFMTDECLDYWNYLLQKGTRDVIDQETDDYCQAVANRLIEMSTIRDLMGMDLPDHLEVINETEFKADLVNYPFGVKGIMDNLVIDHRKKVIRLNDFKTTNRSLADFKEQVEYYQYWLQAAMYTTLVYGAFQELLNRGYTLEFRFIVIDRNLLVYPFLVSEETLHNWIEQMNQVVDKANYHYTNRVYELPYEFCVEQVIL